jgi:ankyrin repeat protein
MTSMKTVHRQIIAAGVFVGSLAAPALGQINSTVPQADQPLIKIPYEEATSHRIGRKPLLRAQLEPTLSGVLFMVGIPVEVEVEPDGAVRSAKAMPTIEADPRPWKVPLNLLSQVESVVRGTRYEPFERDGHAVWASFEEHVAILPLELKPEHHVPFPEVKDWDSVSIKLTRTGCFGSCPSYEVEVHGDGTVHYQGKSYVAILGDHRCSVSEENVRELVKSFRETDYYSLRDEYVAGITDNPTYLSSIQIDGKSKTVKDYVGEMIGMPLEVSDLESAIDHLSEVQRWTRGNADTVGCLKSEDWNFKSQEAAKALVGLARYGNVQAVSDFVAAGTALNGKTESGQTALTAAAYRGDVDMLSVLLKAGAAKVDRAEVAEAFTMASRSGKSEAMNLLLNTGMSASNGKDGRTLLMTTAASGVPNIVGQVLKSHPDVNAQDKNGRTALMESVSQYHYGSESPEINRAEVVRLLLQAGADPNLSDKDGNTALIETAWDADAALLLIRGGANLNAQNKKGMTPLINCANPEVARLLLANGADPSIRAADGKTALDLAKQYGMREKEAVLSTKVR